MIAHFSQGNYAEAERLFVQALELFEKSLGKIISIYRCCQFVNNLAGLYRCQGRYDLSEPLYQRALAVFDKNYGKEHSALNNLGGLHVDQKRYEKAGRQKSS